MRIPIAHADGSYVCDPETLAELQRNDQVVVRYCTPDGQNTAEANPNGSLDSIAGVCNRERNVMGLMPHPERAVEAALDSTDGLVILRSLIAALARQTAVVELAKWPPLSNYDLNALFETQEKAAAENFKRSDFLRKSFAFNSACLRLCLNFNGSEQFTSPEKATGNKGAKRGLSIACGCGIQTGVVRRRSSELGHTARSSLGFGFAAGMSFLGKGMQRQSTKVIGSLMRSSSKNTLRQLGTFGDDIELFWGECRAMRTLQQSESEWRSTSTKA